MASVDWQKAPLSKAGAVGAVHLDKDKRENGNHANKHIDTSKSHLNTYIGADDFAPMLEKVKARIKEVDKENPPERNNGAKRITCIMLETPVPRAVTEQGRDEEYMRDAHKVIEEFFGAENVGGSCGHRDEEHLYIDKDGLEKMSCNHLHTLCAAYSEWIDKKEDKETGEKISIERKGINGKHCKTTPRMRELNKRMDAMSREKYGVPFLTGDTPEKKSIDELKAESELRANIVKNGVKPFVPKPYPKKRELPDKYKEEPVNSYPNYSWEYNNFDKVLEKWRNGRDKEQAKIDKEYEAACKKVDKENEKAYKEWASIQLTASKVAQLKSDLDDMIHQIEPLYNQAREYNNSAKEKEEQAEQLRKDMEAERQRQAQTYAQDVQNAAQKLVDEREDKLFGSDGKSRTERLERFCEGFTIDGENMLKKFNEQEQQRKQNFRGRTDFYGKG